MSFPRIPLTYKYNMTRLLIKFEATADVMDMLNFNIRKRLQAEIVGQYYWTYILYHINSQHGQFYMIYIHWR